MSEKTFDCVADTLSKSEDSKEFINKFLDNWYKVTKENPKLHGHIVLEEKCHNCGEVLQAKEYDDEIRCWFPSCHHQETRQKEGVNC